MCCNHDWHYICEIKASVNFSHQYYNNIQYVPDAFEIGELVYSQLQNLLHDIVEDEQTENHLTTDDEVIPVGDVANQFHCSYLVGRDRSTGRWKFNQQPVRKGEDIS